MKKYILILFLFSTLLLAGCTLNENIPVINQQESGSFVDEQTECESRGGNLENVC